MHFVILAVLVMALTPTMTQAARVGIPMGMSDNIIKIEDQRVTGMFSGLIKCIENQTDISFEWQHFPTRRLLFMIAENKIDLLFPMGFDKKRNKTAIPSTATFSSEDIWIYYGLEPDFNNKDIQIAVKLGSPQENDVKEQGYSNIYSIDYDSILNMLSLKRVEAALLPRTIYAGLANNPLDHKTKLFKKREVGFYFSYAFAFDYLEPINQAIESCL